MTKNSGPANRKPVSKSATSTPVMRRSSCTNIPAKQAQSGNQTLPRAKSLKQPAKTGNQTVKSQTLPRPAKKAAGRPNNTSLKAEPGQRKNTKADATGNIGHETDLETLPFDGMTKVLQVMASWKGHDGFVVG